MPHLYDPTLFSDPRVSPLPPTKPTAKAHQRAYSEKDKVSVFDSRSGIEQCSSDPVSSPRGPRFLRSRSLDLRCRMGPGEAGSRWQADGGKSVQTCAPSTLPREQRRDFHMLRVSPTPSGLVRRCPHGRVRMVRISLVGVVVVGHQGAFRGRNG